MKTKRWAAIVGGVCVCLALSVPLRAADAVSDPVQPTLDKLLKAIETNDYDSFVADGADSFKAALTKPMLEVVSAQYGGRMKKGYERTFLGALKQQGCQVYLWKIAYKDGGDDTLARLVMKDGKIGGFWVQ